jgi:long-subunit acyl-CoA synthetase (AMP-forming)
LIETLKEVRPSMFFAVPRVYEKFEEELKSAGAKAPAFARKISEWAKDKGLRANLARVNILREG